MKKYFIITLYVLVFVINTSAAPLNWTWYIVSTNVVAGSPGYIDVTIGVKANLSPDDNGKLGNNNILGTMSSDIYDFGSGNDPTISTTLPGTYQVTISNSGGSNDWQINCVYNGGTNSGISVTDAGGSIYTIRFFIQNSSGSSTINLGTLQQTFQDDDLTQVNVSYDNSGGNFPLPVELSSFSAFVNLNNVSLSWKTATEVNNNGFEVQREIGSQKSEVNRWEKVGFVQGHGNSNSPKEYSYTDKNLTGGIDFIYRLKQIDNDGKYQYSKEVEVEVVPREINLLQNYPNPFNPVTDIKFTLPEAARVTLRVYNIIGQEVVSLVNGVEEAGFHSVKFEGSNLPSGTYIYRLQAGSFVQTKKMVLLK